MTLITTLRWGNRHDSKLWLRLELQAYLIYVMVHLSTPWESIVSLSLLALADAKTNWPSRWIERRGIRGGMQHMAVGWHVSAKLSQAEGYFGLVTTNFSAHLQHMPPSKIEPCHGVFGYQWLQGDHGGRMMFDWTIRDFTTLTNCSLLHSSPQNYI